MRPLPRIEPPPARRSNDDWVAALRGAADDSAAAAGELEAYLRRLLGRMLHGRLHDGDLAELVQESIVRVIENLESFRGDSAFTTWATAIATRVAFTELRRRQVRAGAYDAVRREVEEVICPDTPSPEARLSRQHLFEVLEHAIASQLTPRQRVAIVAELGGIPTIEIAERLGTNQNALYKLTHDARKKLKAVLLARGFTVESILETVAEGPR